MAETNPVTCAICPETRWLQNCHIVPKCFFTYYVGAEDLYKKSGINIIQMCPNHHYFYDNFLLTKEESEILEPLIKPIFIEAVKRFKLIDHYDAEDKKSWVKNYHLSRLIDKFDKWLEKHTNAYGNWSSK